MQHTDQIKLKLVDKLNVVQRQIPNLRQQQQSPMPILAFGRMTQFPFDQKKILERIAPLNKNYEKNIIVGVIQH